MEFRIEVYIEGQEHSIGDFNITEDQLDVPENIGNEAVETINTYREATGE